MRDKQSFEDELSSAAENYVGNYDLVEKVTYKAGARWALTESSIIREIEAALEYYGHRMDSGGTARDALNKLKEARAIK